MDSADSPAPSKNKLIGGEHNKQEENDSEEPVVALKSETNRATKEQVKDNKSLFSIKDYSPTAVASLKDDSNESPSAHSGKDSETTIDTAHTEEETVQVSPFDPSNANEPLLTDLDDDFISALKSLQVDDDQFDFIPLEQGILEDLEVDPEDRDLLPLEDFSNVFTDEIRRR